MATPMRTESIKAFLNAYAPPDLAALYNYNQEVQIVVAKDNGERTEGDFKGRLWHGYTDGVQTWKPIRIPLNANTTPTYEDSPMGYDLAKHAEGIGMTGWDWVNKTSPWVAFDFDAITGHSDKHSKKLTDGELESIRKAVFDIPWVCLRRSTGGKGLHLYVFLEHITTNNHNEHAAVARAILSHLSGICGFDFGQKVDICGGNMWVWHRKMKDTNGLELLKASTEKAHVPINWRDYTKVVNGHRQKNLPRFIEEQQTDKTDIEDVFNELTGQRLRSALDPEHKKVMDWLTTNYPNSVWWDAEHHMIVTHTALLKECHTALDLRGPFETNAFGNEKGFDINCFAFPISRGGWAVRRYTLGVAEHSFWEQDGAQWTRCFSGDTKVLCEAGVYPIKDMVGKQTLSVLTERGQRWIDSEIKCFGEQEIWNVILTCGEVIETTANHQWLTISSRGVVDLGARKNTFQLQANNLLPLAQRTLSQYDHEGYMHGFVFGDGWLTTNGNQCNVELYGGKVDLLNDLLEYGHYATREKYGSVVPCVRGLPNHWKQIPDFSQTKQYLYGFILGMISSDGHVRGASIILTNKHAENLELIRELCQFVGLRAYQVRPEGDMFAMNISTSNMVSNDFLRADQKEIFESRTKDRCLTVRAVINTGVKKKVYCAVVPTYHNFTLANGVVTGNCFFNREPDLASAARVHKGIEDPSGGYAFSTAEAAQKAAHLIGIDLDLPNWTLGKKAKLAIHKSGKLTVEIDKENDSHPIEGWIVKGRKFVRMFNMKAGPAGEPDILRIDEQVRHLVSSSNDDCGWVIRSEGNWNSEPWNHVKVYLKSLTYTAKDIDTILGASVVQAWKLVNKPFQPEYPKDREWNRGSAQFCFKPKEDRDCLNYPTWLSILNHCGKGLDEAVKNSEWAKSHSVLTGADYLKIWIASLFQAPQEPLPYLFFHGEQNSGKSIFHEALGLLVTNGVIRADNALISQSGFNGELEHSVICVIEETDLRKNLQAYNRIKDWVTSREIPIHRKGQQPYTVPNTTHWIHCANSHLFCPIFPGDTRITMVYVPELSPGQAIPKKLLIPMLVAEAPDFMAELLSLEIPPSGDRLNIPMLSTEEKLATGLANQSMLDMFCEEHVVSAQGQSIRFAEFYTKFIEWLEPEMHSYWTKIRVGKELPRRFLKGRLSSDQTHYYIGNASWTKPEVELRYRLILKDGKLIPHMDTKP